MITALALTSALTFPFGPTVRRWLRSSILPSTLPSTYKSSEPDSSPLITTDLPMLAPSPVCGASIALASIFPRALFAANKPIVNHPLDCGSASQPEIILHQAVTAAKGRVPPTQPSVCYHRLTGATKSTHGTRPLH